ncbi:MAG: AlpA family phage regulatory protein [Holosporaceae bacterium]|jgi:predicted DNA-binding transcriptional regulator AlpA|nr:AlpA family phage regulatory protein [Holosporaceae bacterium]
MKFTFDGQEYITLDEVEKLVEMKQTSIHTRVRFGHFPKPIKFEIRMAWKRSEIDSYLEKTREAKE